MSKEKTKTCKWVIIDAPVELETDTLACDNIV